VPVQTLIKHLSLLILLAPLVGSLIAGLGAKRIFLVAQALHFTIAHAHHQLHPELTILFRAAIA